MARVLTEHAMFLHVPKTGGHWVTEALTQARLAKRVWPQHHWPLEDVKNDWRTLYPGRPLPFLFGFVRHPVSWYHSVWRWYTKRGWRDKGPMVNAAKGLPFREFIVTVTDQCPGHLKQSVDKWLGPREEPVDFIGQFEHLQQNLYEALVRSGHKIDRSVLDGIDARNVNGVKGGQMTDDLVDRIVRSEAELIERFYPNGAFADVALRNCQRNT